MVLCNFLTNRFDFLVRFVLTQNEHRKKKLSYNEVKKTGF